MSQELTSLILRLQRVWGLPVYGHHAVNFFLLVGVLVSVKELRNMPQTLIYVLQGGTKDSVTAIWPIYCLNCDQFSLPLCYFCHHVFTSLQSLILEPGFCDSGEAWETEAFLQTRGRQRTWWGGVCPRKAPIGSCSVTVHSLREHPDSVSDCCVWRLRIIWLCLI